MRRIAVVALVLMAALGLVAPVQAATYPNTKLGVAAAWSKAWWAKDPSAAARYEYHPGPGARPYDNLPRVDGYLKEPVNCPFEAVCFAYYGEPAPGIYMRKVGGRWKVVGVYNGGNTLNPSLVARDYIDGPYCVMKSTWLFNRLGSSTVKVPAGAVVNTTIDAEWPVVEVVWGPYWGKLDAQKAKVFKMPGAVQNPASECKKTAASGLH